MTTAIARTDTDFLLHETRSDADRLRERAGVDRQLDRWRRLRDDPLLRRRLLDGLRRRRVGRLDLLQFDVVPDGAGSEVLAARGELLVRGADLRLPAVRRLADAWDLRAVPVACLESRVVRLVGRTVRDRLPDVLAEIRSLGLPVSINHMTPMAGVMKCLSGPEPSTGAQRFPGAAPGPRPVAVAVLDTGVDARPRSDGWLDGVARADNVDPLDAIPTRDGLLDPGAGHGTFAAGVVQQVAPSVAVRAHRVLDSDGIGSDVRVACAMLRAAEEGADVLNLSLGSHTVDDEPPIALQAALDLLAERHPDVLVVAAAGNDGSERPCWPAAFPDVVAVGGLTPSLGAAEWSNRGDWVTCSTVAEGIVSTYVEGRRADPPAVFGADAWACWTGTSFGAPQLSGAVARRCAEDGTTPRQALAALLVDRPAVPGYGAAVRIMAGT